MIIVVMQGYAVKRVPKMIRGITMALVIALSAVGGIIYLQISKLFYQSNPGMVFGLIAMFDAMVLIFILVSIFFGKYGDPPKNVEGEDNNSRQTEGETYFGNLDDPGFEDSIQDVPFGQDIHEEKIPEMSSFLEASSFQTKPLGVDSTIMHSQQENSIIHGLSMRHDETMNMETKEGVH